MVIIEPCCKRNQMSTNKTTSTLDSSSPTDWCYEGENTTSYNYSYVYERPAPPIIVPVKVKYSTPNNQTANSVFRKIIKDFNHRR